MPIIQPCHAAPSAKVISAERATQTAHLFRAMADPTRLRLLLYIAQAPNGTACSCHLPEALGITQPTMSHHLGKLAEAGLITREQRGRWAHFTATETAGQLIDLATRI